MVCEELAKQAIMCGGKEDTGGKKADVCRYYKGK